ncbi:MAG: hypothetical protein A3I32_01865 [Candidatus Yanofskybacteria bacterium RIFCSPLOWO2_02_FULL_45_10]|uniref:Zinc finger DksA/TraR C4-type domain-containing protein n=1 Tax=Candidatus Yanofskybacteria bacterium RIFCSPLOWO2_02_FULL_45_10 TaxID=1802706 RepID=A0A1F8H5B9_9BACT|nr:MAG: hypothetical protein A3I32_01865 [Candidatus Yanofskybacteria bacterium RIFCSPLOWO2_02_FULL_45_10]
MTEQDKQKLLADLQAEEKKILAELLTFAQPDSNTPDEYTVSVPEGDRSTDDNAGDLSELERLNALKESLVGRLREVRTATKKLEAGEYGKCDNCSAPIESNRLAVMPVARFCMACAEKPALRES